MPRNSPKSREALARRRARNLVAMQYGAWYNPFDWSPVRAMWAVPGHIGRAFKGAYSGAAKSAAERARREEKFRRNQEKLAQKYREIEQEEHAIKGKLYRPSKSKEERRRKKTQKIIQFADERNTFDLQSLQGQIRLLQEQLKRYSQPSAPSLSDSSQYSEYHDYKKKK